MAEEKVYKDAVIVNDQNEVIGGMNFLQAKKEGYKRRGVRVFVFSEDGFVLVQKRSQFVLSPGLLDTAAAGAVDVGEDYDTAAARELEEELGIAGVELIRFADGVLGPSKTSFNSSYKVVIPKDTVIAIDPHEVESVHWMLPSEIDEIIKHTPEKCGGSLLQTWVEFRDTIEAI